MRYLSSSMISLLLFGVCIAEAQTHFSPVSATGKPYAVVVQSATVDGGTVTEGDEVAVFDADLCVGAMTVEGLPPYSITAWEKDDEQSLEGFTVGDTIHFKVYKQEWDAELDVEPIYSIGDGTYGYGVGTNVSLISTLVSPPEFSLISPADNSTMEGETSADVTFQWATSVDPNPEDTVSYELQLSTDEAFTSPVLYQVGETESFVVTDLAMDSYWWRVRAFDTQGLETFSTETWRINVTLGVEEFGSLIPDQFSIERCYPNPFNPSLNIMVSLPTTAPLRVTISNVVGKSIAELASGRFQAGYHTFSFNGSGVASGIYFVHAVVPGKMNEVRKVVLMK